MFLGRRAVTPIRLGPPKFGTRQRVSLHGDFEIDRASRVSFAAKRWASI
jgi:hypothetical protein